MIKGEYSRNLPLPLISCSDGVGEVVAFGEGVLEVNVGDRAAGAFMPHWIDRSFDKKRYSIGLGWSH